MASASHISFEQRKGLAVRLIALPLLHQHEARLLQVGAQNGLQWLRGEISYLAGQAIMSPPGEHLDSNLKDLAKTLLTASASHLTGTFAPRFSPLLTQLTGHMNALSCCTCSGSPSVCEGGQNDDALVAGGGHCIGLLRQLFDVALQIAQDAFHRYLPALSLPAVGFSTAHWNKKPHDIPVELYCGGSTAFANGGNSVVQLHLTPAALDWDTCLACLYVLVHECFCHAFYGARNPSKREEGTGNDDPFTEGWMDWLAHELLLKNVYLAHGLPASGTEFASIATIFTEARSQYTLDGSKPQSTYALSRFLGKEAAIKMHGLLKRLPESRAGALEALFRLSCDVLAEGFPLQKHEAFVYEVNMGLPSPGGQEDPYQFEEIPRSVRMYLINNKLNTLFPMISPAS